jgi:uncharacterized membrane protein
MKMYAKPLIGAVILIGLMVAASAWAWPRLGDQPLPFHYGLNGPDRYGSKAEAVLALPIVAVLLSLVFTALPPLMPARARLERSWGAFVTMWMALLVFLLVLHLVMLARDLGTPLAMERIVPIGVGLLTAVTGNLLGKVRYNYVFGVRTPWTLANERVWDRTHRFAGWAMVLGGLTAVCIGLLIPTGLEPQLHVLILICVVGPALAAVVYSYIESRRLGAT